MKSVTLTFLLLASLESFATNCGIKPKGMEFGPNCELIRTKPAPQKKAVPLAAPLAAAAPQWEALQLGAYTGKPGYYVNIGNEFQLKVDALLMNEDVLAKVRKATSELKLGGFTTCQGVGLQQPIGYTLFDVRNCEEKPR